METDYVSMDSLREVFSFSRAETIALCILLTICLIGGGILLYEHSRQSLPPQMIFESLSAAPSSSYNTAEEKPISSSAMAASMPPRQSTPTSQTRLRVNINTAPAESLVLLPFVGATLSARIVDYREKHGQYDSVGQLVEVYGIGPKSIEKIRPYLICE